MKATRDAYGEALVQLGESNPDIVVLDSDLSSSTKTGFLPRRSLKGFSTQELLKPI